MTTSSRMGRLSLIEKKMDILVKSQSTPKLLNDVLSLLCAMVLECEGSEAELRRRVGILEAAAGGGGGGGEHGSTRHGMNTVAAPSYQKLVQLEHDVHQLQNDADTLKANIAESQAAFGAHALLVREELDKALLQVEAAGDHLSRDVLPEHFQSYSVSFAGELKRMVVAAGGAAASAMRDEKERCCSELRTEAAHVLTDALQEFEGEVRIAGFKGTSSLRQQTKELEQTVEACEARVRQVAEAGVQFLGNSVALLHTTPLEEVHELRGELAFVSAQVELLMLQGSSCRSNGAIADPWLRARQLDSELHLLADRVEAEASKLQGLLGLWDIDHDVVREFGLMESDEVASLTSTKVQYLKSLPVFGGPAPPPRTPSSLRKKPMQTVVSTTTPPPPSPAASQLHRNTSARLPAVPPKADTASSNTIPYNTSTNAAPLRRGGVEDLYRELFGNAANNSTTTTAAAPPSSTTSSSPPPKTNASRVRQEEEAEALGFGLIERPLWSDEEAADDRESDDGDGGTHNRRGRRRPTAVTVASLMVSSRAERAGFEVGDQLMKVNGVECNGMAAFCDALSQWRRKEQRYPLLVDVLRPITEQRLLIEIPRL